MRIGERKASAKATFDASARGATCRGFHRTFQSGPVGSVRGPRSSAPLVAVPCARWALRCLSSARSEVADGIMTLHRLRAAAAASVSLACAAISHRFSPSPHRHSTLRGVRVAVLSWSWTWTGGFHPRCRAPAGLCAASLQRLGKSYRKPDTSIVVLGLGCKR